MTLLDQAMAAVSSGEVVRVGLAGEIYCRLLSACERAVDVRRAEQWLAVATRFEQWGDFVPPTCRMHYGGILIALGRWDEAEHELLAAIRIFETGYWASQLFAILRLTDLRVRQGRFEEAERLLEGFDWHANAKRSLAKIALARGDLALAGDLGRLCLESTPPSDPDCAPVLALLIEVQLAGGQLAAADEALHQLSALAVDRKDERTRAVARLAEGMVRAARGDEHARADFQAGAGAVLGSRSEPRGRAGPGGARPGAPLACARGGGRRGAERVGDLRAARRDPGRRRRRGAAPRLGGAGSELPEGLRGADQARDGGPVAPRRGLLEAEIAQRLYISLRTAEHHVAHILTKLGLRSRAEAAAYALREEIKNP